jgi:hypothetical protein
MIQPNKTVISEDGQHMKTETSFIKLPTQNKNKKVLPYKDFCCTCYGINHKLPVFSDVFY